MLKYKKTITSVLDLLAASWSGVNCQRSIAFTFAPWVISNSVTWRRKKHINLHFSEFVGLILSFSSLLSKLSWPQSGHSCRHCAEVPDPPCPWRGHQRHEWVAAGQFWSCCSQLQGAEASTSFHHWRGSWHWGGSVGRAASLRCHCKKGLSTNVQGCDSSPSCRLQQVVLLVVGACEDRLGQRVRHVQCCFLLRVAQTWVRAVLCLYCDQQLPNNKIIIQFI